MENSLSNTVTNAILKVGISRLLKEEKRRRGFDEHKLVFIGMADTAAFYWCNMKSVFSNQEMEAAFFASYLHDRLLYSLELGYINSIPNEINELLTTGDEITFDDLEKLLENRKILGAKPPPYILISSDDLNQKLMVLNPSISVEEKKNAKALAVKEGIKIMNLDDLPPKLRGELYEEFIAERYPTLRWNFQWNDFVIVGVPDGISDEFVYEFKTTASEFLLAYLEPCALAQGDLYGYFFKRKFKRVQVYVIDEKNIYTWHETVDTSRAVNLLKSFKMVYEEGKAAPPERWKCRNCEFRQICSIKLT